MSAMNCRSTLTGLFKQLVIESINRLEVDDFVFVEDLAVPPRRYLHGDLQAVDLLVVGEQNVMRFFLAFEEGFPLEFERQGCPVVEEHVDRRVVLTGDFHACRRTIADFAITNPGEGGLLIAARQGQQHRHFRDVAVVSHLNGQGFLVDFRDHVWPAPILCLR